MLKTIYFLCTGNSCRTQMAEGYMRKLGGSRNYYIYTAGLEAHGLNSRAVQVMQDDGVDISSQTSNVIDPDLLEQADIVITLCGHADEHCPIIRNPNTIKIHWGFEDPAKASGTEEEIMYSFRTVRDQIKSRITSFLDDGKL